MKNIFLILISVAMLVSCSGKKEVVQQSHNWEGATSTVISYGTGGKIISSPKKLQTNEVISGQDDELEIVEIANKNVEAMKSESQRYGKIQNRNENSKSKTRETVSRAEKMAEKQYSELYGNKTKSGNKRRNGFAIAGFVLSFFVVLAPLAIVFSALGLKSEKKGLAVAGLILSCFFIAILIAIIILNFGPGSSF